MQKHWEGPELTGVAPDRIFLKRLVFEESAVFEGTRSVNLLFTIGIHRALTTASQAL